MGRLLYLRYMGRTHRYESCRGFRQPDVCQKAISWLKSIQREDGSWGESCKSCEAKRFVPLHFGTVVQSSWALEALLQYERPDDPQIIKGIRFLIDEHESSRERLEYRRESGCRTNSTSAITVILLCFHCSLQAHLLKSGNEGDILNRDAYKEKYRHGPKT